MLPLNHRQVTILKLIAVNLFLLAVVVLWAINEPAQSVDIAVAKGKQMLDMNLAAAPSVDSLEARRIALESPQLADAEYCRQFGICECGYFDSWGSTLLARCGLQQQ